MSLTFCHKIVHCLFSTWHKDLQTESSLYRKKRNCNFVLMCHMSSRLCFIISCGYNKRSSTIRHIITLIVPDVYILPDTGIFRGIYIYIFWCCYSIEVLRMIKLINVYDPEKVIVSTHSVHIKLFASRKPLIIFLASSSP
jgi:hypothetical protein